MKHLTPALLLFLTACGISDVDEGEIGIWVDPSSGCRYIHYDNGLQGNGAVESLTIRFNRDGTPDCPGTKEGSP